MKVILFSSLSAFAIFSGCSIANAPVTNEAIINTSSKQNVNANAEAETESPAAKALMLFLQALSDKKYDVAVASYGGEYDILREMNPSVPQDDFAQLWKQGCEVNGLICLPVKEVREVEEELDANEYIITVTLRDVRGETYAKRTEAELGPGESVPVEQTEFYFTVVKQGEKFLVVDLPPYQQ